MNNEKMGHFIAELRRTHQMTQKELAAKLDVSDKAVSKWERGQSYPDILLLAPLSESLGITVMELLDGERAGQKTAEAETSVINALEYVGKTAKSKIKLVQTILTAAFSITILLGIFVVSIVDVAISGTFTWSPIPISACVFAWIIGFPALKAGVKGIFISLIALSLIIAPFLFALDHVVNKLYTDNAPIFTMGIGISLISVAYIWIVFFLLKKRKIRKLIIFAILALLASPLTFFINLVIAGVLGQPWFDVWTVLNISTPVMVAVILFVIDYISQKRDLF